MLKLEYIKEIYQSKDALGGYYIEFQDGNKIHLTKRRTIIALLVLIKNGEGTETDIAQGNSTISEIKNILGDKIPATLIQDYYGDANKPYSELWNEEGFTFIDNLKGGRAGKSQKYVLKATDHTKLFDVVKKANRRAPTNNEKEALRNSQDNTCNLCGSKLLSKSQLKNDTYAKDRRREVFDHRRPVERGGDSSLENYQALCFYCNKCKWQICNICPIPECDETCVLRNPELSSTITPTGEDISDLLANKSIDEDNQQPNNEESPSR